MGLEEIVDILSTIIRDKENRVVDRLKAIDTLINLHESDAPDDPNVVIVDDIGLD